MSDVQVVAGLLRCPRPGPTAARGEDAGGDRPPDAVVGLPLLDDPGSDAGLRWELTRCSTPRMRSW